jgi:hypothetical protein
MDTNLATPYIQTWTLGIQHAIVNNVVLEVNYVANHGVKLIGRQDDNQALPFQMWNQPSAPGGPTFAQNCATLKTASACNGDAFSGLVGTNPGTARPFTAKFPHLANIIRVTNPHTSNYQGLQMSLSARNFHGMSLNSGYTWSKSLDIASTSGSGVGTDSYLVGIDYGRASSDIRHRFTLSGVYQVPGVAGYGGLFEGWKVNGVFRFQTGRPWAGGASGDFLGKGGSSRWDFTGDVSDFVVDYHQLDLAKFHPGGTTPVTQTSRIGDLAINNSQCTAAARSAATLQAFGCWTHGASTITPPPVNTIGNMTRGLFSGPRYVALDFSVTKRQTITERFSAEFRAETFNTLNHPALGQPGTSLTNCSATSCGFGLPTNTPAVAATNSYLGTGGPRRMQFGVKLIF